MDDFGLCAAIVILAFFIGFIIGVVGAKPIELENGCYVDGGKIYCEKVEVIE